MSYLTSALIVPLIWCELIRSNTILPSSDKIQITAGAEAFTRADFGIYDLSKYCLYDPHY